MEKIKAGFILLGILVILGLFSFAPKASADYFACGIDGVNGPPSKDVTAYWWFWGNESFGELYWGDGSYQIVSGMTNADSGATSHHYDSDGDYHVYVSFGYCTGGQDVTIDSYSYQYPYPYPYEYPYPYPYEYPYPTPAYGYQYPYPYETPYSYQTPYPYQSPYAYQTPYTYETPYAYPTPGYGYPTPAYGYPYETPYAYPTPGYGYPTPAYGYPTPAIAFNYSLTSSGNSNVTKTSGSTFTQNTITMSLLAGASEPVSLTLSGVPAGVTYSISNAGCLPTCTSIITFTVAPTTPVGTHTITVTGSPLNKQTTFNLIVSGNPSVITCSASPSTALIGQTVTWSATVSGGTPPYTYSWSGTNIPTSPAPNTNPFNIIYNTIGTKSAVLTVTDADSIVASCPAATIRINFNPAFEEF